MSYVFGVYIKSGEHCDSIQEFMEYHKCTTAGDVEGILDYEIFEKFCYEKEDDFIFEEDTQDKDNEDDEYDEDIVDLTFCDRWDIGSFRKPRGLIASRGIDVSNKIVQSVPTAATGYDIVNLADLNFEASDIANNYHYVIYKDRIYGDDYGEEEKIKLLKKLKNSKSKKGFAISVAFHL